MQVESVAVYSSKDNDCPSLVENCQALSDKNEMNDESISNDGDSEDIPTCETKKCQSVFRYCYNIQYFY